MTSSALLASVLGGAALALAAVAAPADAAIRVARDDQGRSIRFDVRAPQVDVEGYRKLISGLVHGDEIEDVTFRVVPRARVGPECLSDDALACYSAEPGVRPTIVVPAGRPSRVVNVVTHEYGHHIDRSYDHRSFAPDYDGTARWWSLRKMPRLLRTGAVAWDYRKGWGRSLAEIFAEDYVVLNQPGGPYDIFLLRRPSTALREALRRDVEEPRGLSRQRLGPSWLAPRGTRTVTFQTAPGRRRLVVITRIRNRRGARPLRTTLSCDEGGLVRRSLARRTRLGAIRVAAVPVGRCQLTLEAGRAPVLYETTVLHKG
jgi:hypothetical protein